MWRFAYYGIRREDCEGMSCYYTPGEASVTASRLTSVVFFTLLGWLTWWIRPRLWYAYPLEEIGVFEMYYIPCTDTGSSVMILGEAWWSDSGGRYWVPGYKEFSYQSSLGRGILENFLRWHYFERVKFPCLESSMCSSTRFFHCTENMPFLMCSTVKNVS